MNTIYKHELKTYIKTLLIWFICVGGIGFACILLFTNMKGEMAGMADSFASMGAFSDAFGMSKLSIATMSGFYSAEVGTVHALGGAMFSAIISTVMLSKEEDGHTGEFLFSLPVSRGKVVVAKWLATVTVIILFNVLCVLFYTVGFAVLGEGVPATEFLLFHTMQTLMHIEIATICFCISAFMKKNKFALGLGIVLLLYAFDLIARVIPDLSDSKIISPFSYANASDIISSGEISVIATVIGVIILITCFAVALRVYTKKDLAS